MVRSREEMDMASKSTGSGPDQEERDAPGDTSTNPTGTSSDKPAEGADDAAPKELGSPDG